MPIAASELKYYKSSSGVGLGGPISAVQITTGNINNVWDDVSSVEAAAGDEEYRCIYVKNENALIDLINSVLFVDFATPSDDTSLEIGVGIAGVGGAEQVIPDEVTAPGGVAFFNTAVDFANALVLGTIPKNGGYIGVWLKRIVDAGADAYANDGATLAVAGDTTA